MGLKFSFTFSAPQERTNSELETFLKSVESDAKGMGFEPTHVFRATFETRQQRDFARQIRTMFRLTDERLKGVVLFSENRTWRHNPDSGDCWILPDEAVVLVVTNEHGMECVFGFASYPDTLNDINGKPLLKIPVGGRWYFSDFVQTPDHRYRKIVNRFAEGGFLESSTDDFYAAKTLTKEQFDKIITENQSIQKGNPFGSEAHRKAYEAIRKAVKEFKGIDIGEYIE